jgi:hypothetical protein
MMHAFLVTLIHGSQRTERRVIAPNSVQAAIIGIGLMPDTHAPLSIFCKPLERIAR